MPGPPLFFLTRFRAAFRFGRVSASSISLLPGCPLPRSAVEASTLRPSLEASPRLMNGSSSCPGFCGLAPSRFKRASPSFTFGPSLPRAAVSWPLLTPRSGRLPGRRPFRRKARSPQVRTRPFAARPPDLRRLGRFPPAVCRWFRWFWGLGPRTASSRRSWIARSWLFDGAAFPRAPARPAGIGLAGEACKTPTCACFP